MEITKFLCNYGPEDPLWYTASWTRSLDAKLPWENIKYVFEIAGKWQVNHFSDDGKIYTAIGKTEPLARRAAALKGKP